MPVAVETFTADYAYGVGGVTEVVVGEWCAPGHELVRRFPQNFAPAPGRDKPRVRQRTSAPPPALRRTRAPGMPERRFRVHHAVAFNRWAWNDISAEVGDGLESGGVLIGERAPDGSFLVSAASGPGEGAARCSFAIRHDLDRYRQIADTYADAGLRMLGFWHEHPGGNAEPSETDLRSWDAATGFTDDGVFLGVIAATRLDDPNPYTFLRLHAWTCEDGIVEPCDVFTDRWEIPE